MQQLGERIKKNREKLGYQVNDLASKIGVTPSLISQIERAKAFPSILTLKKIADALHTTVGELIGENEKSIQNPVLKIDERKFVKDNDNGTRLFLLSHYESHKQIAPYLIDFEKKADSSGIMTTNRPGQEFCFVLKGSFETIINKQKYKLTEGDSFYFNSNQDHLFTNTSKNNAQLLWIAIQPDI